MTCCDIQQISNVTINAWHTCKQF